MSLVSRMRALANWIVFHALPAPARVGEPAARITVLSSCTDSPPVQRRAVLPSARPLFRNMDCPGAAGSRPGPDRKRGSSDA